MNFNFNGLNHLFPIFPYEYIYIYFFFFFFFFFPPIFFRMKTVESSVSPMNMDLFVGFGGSPEQCSSTPQDEDDDLYSDDLRPGQAKGAKAASSAIV